MSEVIALLPILDAVAAGQRDAGRVERWANTLMRSGRAWKDIARAAMALADAEAASKLTTG